MKPFEITFDIIGEIRHGSPYNLAELHHTGGENIKLKVIDSWQDMQSWTQNGNFVALVKWEFKNSDPGFNIILLNANSGETTKSEWIKGCCDKIKLSNDLTLKYGTYTLISDKNEDKKYGVKEGIIKLKSR